MQGLGIKAPEGSVGLYAGDDAGGHQSSILQDFRAMRCQFSDIWPFQKLTHLAPEDSLGTKDPHFFWGRFSCFEFLLN